MRTIFSTGQAAKICMVSQQTIIRSFDEGELEGFRVPRSKFRRITRQGLINYMEKYHIPMTHFPFTDEERLSRGEILQEG